MADDPGNRGRLVLRDRVAQRIATRAAHLTDGVQAHSGGLDKLTGRELPRATVHVAGDRARAQIDIAVCWPRSATAVAADVQRNVTEALQTYADLTVDTVDVSIDAVVPAHTPARTVS
ncbi:Asp23/Gls24 family envelope stress response protein [Mycolicibacterium sp.]|uniref:Asp23/Gls24 family envelope stress response protein n=1 Tax=Mycolicibacterium sp. TaxID=2320850 RepID=UPI0025E38BDD|nr:Asp23/Gls24 family envelope stress response protein [Mycolicibacterium sp.]